MEHLATEATKNVRLNLLPMAEKYISSPYGGGRISYYNGGKGSIRQVRPVSLFVKDWAKEAVFLNGKNITSTEYRRPHRRTHWATSRLPFL